MRLLVRLRWLGLAVASVAVGCSVSDNSSQVTVEVRQSDSLVARGVIEKGKFDSVTARAVQSATAGDTQPVSNVTFTWSTSDANIAKVEPTGPASAQVIGVGAGYVTISATASGFEKSVPGTTRIRVSAAVHIDSIRPTTVPYGAKLTVYGVGVNNIFGITLGPGDLISDIYAFRGYKGGIGESDWWVPFPANDHRAVIRFAGGDSLKDTTLIKVLPWDYLEPNDWDRTFAPPPPRAQIDINGAGGPRTIAGFPALYFNPALYFEPGDTIAGDTNFFNDWYRFSRTDTTSAISYQLSVPSITDSTFTYFTNSLSGYFAGAPGSWIVNLGQWYDCDNASFYPGGQLLPTSPRLALPSLPDTAIELLSFFQNPGRYTVQVVQGYATPEQRIQPDRFEPDDIWCRYVDDRFNNSTDSTSPNALHIVVGKTFGGWYDSTLVLENPGAIDVIRFRVLAPGPADSTFLGIAARPFPGQTDRSQFSAQVFPVSQLAANGYAYGGGFDSHAASPYNTPCPYSNSLICLYWIYGYPYGYQFAGYPNGQPAYLAAGDYYLVVADQAGNATRYSVCITVGGGCTPPAVPPAPTQPPPGAPRANLQAGVSVPVSSGLRPPHLASDFLKQRLGARQQLRRR